MFFDEPDSNVFARPGSCWPIRVLVPWMNKCSISFFWIWSEEPCFYNTMDEFPASPMSAPPWHILCMIPASQRSLSYHGRDWFTGEFSNIARNIKRSKVSRASDNFIDPWSNGTMAFCRIRWSMDFNRWWMRWMRQVGFSSLLEFKKTKA